MSKKILALLLTLTMAMVVFVGCGENNDNSEDSGSNDSSESATTDVEPVDTRTVFVSPEWIKSVIDGNQDESEDYIVLEASWGTADDSPNYNDEHIPGAIHADIASVEEEPYWNLKSAEDIEKSLVDLGITSDTTVILYGPDVSGTARVAYAYLWAGVENVKVLNGGLDAWKSAEYNLESEPNSPSPVDSFGVEVPAHPEYWLSIEDAAEKLENDDNFKLVSIRSYEEFIGETSGYSYIDKAGEPKGAVWGKAGSDPYHMEDYTNEDGTYIDMDQMLTLWEDLDFTVENELSFYCGTGWRASIPFLIMYQNGYDNISMYDGGWYQWQMDDDLPVQVGDPSGDDITYTTVGELSNDKAAQ